MKIKVPKIKIKAPRRKPTPAPTPVSRGRSRAKYGPEGKAARAREHLADRADTRPIRSYGARQTPADDRAAYGTRNYPPQRGSRTRDPLANARDQLAGRRALRTAAGHPETKPHPMSGEGARSSVRARGVAKRPASALPGYAPAKHSADPSPQTHGKGFAGLFFGGRTAAR